MWRAADGAKAIQQSNRRMHNSRDICILLSSSMHMKRLVYKLLLNWMHNVIPVF